MQIRRTTAKLAIVFVGLGTMLATPSHALFCQYQGRPGSVIRSEPGFGVVFGTFHLTNSPKDCPHNIQAIQFSGSESALFVSKIETCLNMATLLVVNEGLVTFYMDDPLTGEPGILIGNARGGPIDSCRISR
jgi:hypothetical protein